MKKLSRSQHGAAVLGETCVAAFVAGWFTGREWYGPLGLLLFLWLVGVLVLNSLTADPNAEVS